MTKNKVTTTTTMVPPVEILAKKTEETFLDRLKKEESELNEKCEKLGDFIYSGKIDTIDKQQARLMRQQLGLMRNYLDVLKQRIQLL